MERVKKITAMVIIVSFVLTGMPVGQVMALNNMRTMSTDNTVVANNVGRDSTRNQQDGGTSILQGLTVNGIQQAIDFLQQFRDNQYMNAVRSVNTARFFAAFTPGEFAPGKDLFDQLRKYGQSVIAVNIVSYNEIEGHLRAAIANNSALIIEVARSQIGYALDEKKVVEYTRELAKKLNCTIPIIIHGDHIQYTQELFDVQAILKDAYEAVNGKGTFKTGMDVNLIDEAILKKAADKLKENAPKERKDTTAIIERLIVAGFTSIAIDASTIFDEFGEISLQDIIRPGEALRKKLVIQLEESGALPLEWDTDFLKYYPDKDIDKLEQKKSEVINELRKRSRSEAEIAAKTKEMDSAFGALVVEARKNNLDPEKVIDVYDRLMEEINAAQIAGEIPPHIAATLTAKEKMLLLPTNNVAETAFQSNMIDELVKKYNPKLLGHIGKEIEAGHVDKKVPNPRRGNKLEPKMTHPAAIQVMIDRLLALGVTFDIVAVNNGSGHGTDYELDSLTPKSQVGKISPYLTAQINWVLKGVASLAQHGTSGSDMEELAELSKAGVVKFNIATNNQQTQLNVHFLSQTGIQGKPLRGKSLLKEVQANPQRYVEGLTDEVRIAMKEMAQGLKSGKIEETIDATDKTFTRFIKLTYAWAKKKNKVKESSSKEDIALIFAKEFKRAFKDMDPILYAIGHTKLIKRAGVGIGGGLAAGQNSAIYWTVKEYKDNDVDVVPIYKGWEGLVNDELIEKSMNTILTVEDLESYRTRGGGILGTSRENLYKAKDGVKGKKAAETYRKLELDSISIFGGDDTGKTGGLFQKENPDFTVMGLAKTMDGDILFKEKKGLTYGIATFTKKGIEYVKDSLGDYKDTGRIGVIGAFGRAAGFVITMIGAGVDAAYSLIPEQLIDLDEFLADMRAYKKKFGYGVVLVAEGATIISEPEEIKDEYDEAKKEALRKQNEVAQRNKKVLEQALANDDRATAAYYGKNVKRDNYDHPKLEDGEAVIRAVLEWGGIKTSLTGKMDYAMRSPREVDEVDLHITETVAKAMVTAVISGEKNQLFYYLEGEAASMPLSDPLSGRKLDYLGEDKDVYLKANQALGMGKAEADGGTTRIGVTEIFGRSSGNFGDKLVNSKITWGPLAVFEAPFEADINNKPSARVMKANKGATVYPVMIDYESLLVKSPDGLMALQNLINQLGKGSIKYVLHINRNDMNRRQVDQLLYKINILNEGFTAITRDSFAAIVIGTDPKEVAQEVQDKLHAPIYQVIGSPAYVRGFEKVQKVVLDQAEKGQLTSLAKALKLGLELIPTSGKMTDQELKQLDALFSQDANGAFHVAASVVTDRVKREADELARQVEAEIRV